MVTTNDRHKELLARCEEDYSTSNEEALTSFYDGLTRKQWYAVDAHISTTLSYEEWNNHKPKAGGK